jgi:hypothetical protein
MVRYDSRLNCGKREFGNAWLGVGAAIDSAIIPIHFILSRTSNGNQCARHRYGDENQAVSQVAILNHPVPSQRTRLMGSVGTSSKNAFLFCRQQPPNTEFESPLRRGPFVESVWRIETREGDVEVFALCFLDSAKSELQWLLTRSCKSTNRHPHPVYQPSPNCLTFKG